MAESIYDKMMSSLRFDANAGTGAMNAAAGAFQGMASTFNTMRQSIIDEEQKNLQREMEKQHHQEEMDYKDRSLAQADRHHTEDTEFNRWKTEGDWRQKELDRANQLQIAGMRTGGGGGGGGRGRGRKSGGYGLDQTDLDLAEAGGLALGNDNENGNGNSNSNRSQAPARSSGNTSSNTQSTTRSSNKSSVSARKLGFTDAMFDLLAGDMQKDNPVNESDARASLSLGLNDNPVKRESSGSPVSKPNAVSRGIDLGGSSLRIKNAFDEGDDAPVIDQGMPLSIYPSKRDSQNLDMEQVKREGRAKAYARSLVGSAIQARLQPNASNDPLENLTGIRTKRSTGIQDRFMEAPRTDVEIPDDPRLLQLQGLRESISGNTDIMQPRNTSAVALSNDPFSVRRELLGADGSNTNDNFTNIFQNSYINTPNRFELNDPNSSFTYNQNEILQNRQNDLMRYLYDTVDRNEQIRDDFDRQRDWFKQYALPKEALPSLENKVGIPQNNLVMQQLDSSLQDFNKLSTNDKIQEITRKKLQANQDYLGLLSDNPSEADRQKAETIRRQALGEATAEVEALYGKAEKPERESTMLDEVGPALDKSTAETVKKALKDQPIIDENADIVDPAPNPNHWIDFGHGMTSKDYMNYTGTNVRITGEQAARAIQGNKAIFNRILNFRKSSKTKSGVDYNKFNKYLINYTYNLASLPERERAAAMEALMAAKEVFRSRDNVELEDITEKMAKALGTTFSPTYNARDNNYRGRLLADIAISFGVDTDRWEGKRATFQANINNAYKTSRNALGIVKVGRMGSKDINELMSTYNSFEPRVKRTIQSAFNSYYDFDAPIRYARTYLNQNGAVDPLCRDIAATAHANAMGVVLDSFAGKSTLFGSKYTKKTGFDALMRDIQDPNTEAGRMYLEVFKNDIARMERGISK